MHALTVIIPTYNRRDVLARCLAHLEAQTCKDFEVVVVDDGSTDDTTLFLAEYAKENRLTLNYVSQTNLGQASARNHGASLSRSPICLLIGDDILASPHLVEKHLQIHTTHPSDRVVCLGLTQWSEDGQTVTPFMRWLEEGGMQFNYTPLLNGQAPDWRFFYTSNLSMKSEVLKSTPFDESFRSYGMEDMELGCRLERDGGLELIFEPSALAYHFHPTTFADACRRMVKVGEASAHFDSIWPGKRTQLYPGRLAQFFKGFLRRNPWAAPIFVRLGEWSLEMSCPNLWARYVLACHGAVGYHRASPRKQG